MAKLPKNETQTSKVLKALRKNRKSGITNKWAEANLGFNASKVIYQLKQKGHEVAVSKGRDGQIRYKLLSK